MKGLNERMRRFAGEYVKDFCAVKAAVRAGYAESLAKIRGPELVMDARVQLLVREIVATKRAQVPGYRYELKRDLAELVARRVSGQNYGRTGKTTEVLAEVLVAQAVDGTEVLTEVLGWGEAQEAGSDESDGSDVAC